MQEETFVERRDTGNGEESPILLSVVVPVYNEEDNVGILYEEIRASLDPLGKRYEILLVDDGSTDGTFRTLRALTRGEREEGKSLVTTRILRLARNFGQTAAMQAGFDCARGDAIVSLDGDLQNDPQDIPRLLSRLDEGYDVVCGWRKDRKDRTITRVIPSRAANWIIGLVTGVRIHDSGCSLKAYRAEVIKSVRLYSDMHRFIPPMCSMIGARISEIVVNHRPRRHGTTKYGMSRTWKVLLDIVTVKMLIDFYGRPLSFFSAPGLLSLVGAFVLGAGAVAGSIQGHHTVVLTGASLLLFSLFGSLLSWGLLAEYFVRAVVRRPFSDEEAGTDLKGSLADSACGEGRRGG